MRVGADAAQRVALVSFGWGESRLKWSVVLLALLLSGSLALLSNTCASAYSHEGTAGAAISGLVRRLFWVFFCTLLLFWKRRRRSSLSCLSFCSLLMGLVESAGSVGADMVVLVLAKKLNSGALVEVGEEVM